MTQYQHLPERSTLADDGEANASEIVFPIQLVEFWKSFIPSYSADDLSLSTIDKLLNEKQLNLINRSCSCQVGQCIHL